MNNNTVQNGKQTAIISYITIFGVLIAFFMNNDNKNTFASFHIRQSLGICLSWLSLGYFVGYFDSWMVSSGFYIFIFILWIYAFIGAIQGEQREIPILGTFFQKLFKSL